MADVTAHDFQLRAITTSFMNFFDFWFSTWWPLIFYSVTDAPNYRKGYIASIVTESLFIPMVLLIAYLERRGIQNGTLGRKFDTAESGGDESIKGVAGITEVQLPEKI
jgi:ACS family pantothenate transporter-like MFS transporter